MDNNYLSFMCLGTIIFWPLKYLGSLQVARLISGGFKKFEDPDFVGTGHFIFASLLVMAAAGYLFGRWLGFPLVGLSPDPKDWPGMIVFFLASMVGSSEIVIP